MKTVSVISYGVSILAAYLIYGVLSGKRPPLIGSDKSAFFVLWVIGLSMSILAGTRDMVDGKFVLPGYLNAPLMAMGFGAFVLLAVMLGGIRTSFLPGYRQGFVVLAVLIGAKWVMVHSYFFTRAVVQTLTSMLH